MSRESGQGDETGRMRCTDIVRRYNMCCNGWTWDE